MAVLHNRALNYAATGRLPVPNIGGALNDNVGLIQVYYPAGPPRRAQPVTVGM